MLKPKKNLKFLFILRYFLLLQQMNKNKKIVTTKEIMREIASFLLLSMLFFPSTIQFAHAIEGHEHTTCQDVNTHYHEAVTDCDIFDFHFVPFTYNLYSYPELIVSTIPAKVKKHFSPLPYTPFLKTNTQLRAPPYFLA